MSKHLERELDNLQRDIMKMAAIVEETVYKSVRALRERDAALAREVIEGESDIDSQENDVEEECLKILALHQPVAFDLRRIASAMKINSELERMADLSEAIAKKALILIRNPQLEVPEDLQPMADLVTSTVRQSLDAFVSLDPHLARRVIRLDDEVDAYKRDIIQQVIATMKQSPHLIEPALSMLSAVRHLERIADHATNIAEDVVYLVEGEIVRHRPEAVQQKEEGS
ncbi:MAG: phosphate signaling complex protein PhoU [Gemmataceae bacterium]